MKSSFPNPGQAIISLAASTICLASMSLTSLAADLAPPPPPPTGSFLDGIDFSLLAQGGGNINPAFPRNGQNFGQFYNDHANQLQLNQLTFTAAKQLDPAEKDYAFGFVFQALYGSDMRQLHTLGICDSCMNDRNQLGLLQAHALAHLPWITANGMDVKAGLIPSPMGFETPDPTYTPFYSHSYIYNYAVTYTHVGVLTTTHLNDDIDLWVGLDTGNSTSFGRDGDPNDQPAGYIGLGFKNLLDGKLSVLALSHIGPETPLRINPNANRDLRYFNDVLITYKASDELSFNTELNYLKDESFGGADAYGVAQYVSLALTPEVTFNARGEVFRDSNGFFVANFPDNLGLVRAAKGLPTRILTAPPTTYGELTLGLTIKPPVKDPVKLLMIRPEIRYDRSLNGTQPFNGGKARDQLTLATDITVKF